MKNLKWIPIVLMVTGMIISCGYHFEGGGYLKNNFKRVYVQILANRTSETGAETVFTNALVSEILQKTDTRVVDSAENVPVLKGTIKSVTFETLSRSSSESVVERRVSARVDLELVDSDKKTVWSVTDFAWHEEYNVSADKITDEANKKQALEKIAHRIAEKLVGRMQNNF